MQSLWPEGLDRHHLVQFEIFCFVHFSHPTLSNEAQDLESAAKNLSFAESVGLAFQGERNRCKSWAGEKSSGFIVFCEQSFDFGTHRVIRRFRPQKCFPLGRLKLQRGVK